MKRRGECIRTHGQLRLTAALAATALVFITGCGSDQAGDDSSSGSSQDYAAAAEKYMAPVTDFTGPKEGPPAQPDKTVMLISCGEASVGCSVPVQVEKQAAEAIGWDSIVCDGEFDPNVYNDCIEQGINEGVDGILMHAITDDLVSGPLQEARQAGIEVVSTGALNQPSPNGVSYDISANYEKQGTMAATLALADNGTDMTVLIQDEPSYRSVGLHNSGAEETLDQAGASTEEFKFSEKDLATTVPQRTAAAIQANPDIKAVINFDDALLQVIPALREAGLSDQVDLIGWDVVALDQVKSGDLAGTVGVARGMEGYSAIDAMNRLFAGDEPPHYDVPLRLFSQDNASDVDGSIWYGDFDYRSAYTALWGTD